MTPSQLLNSVNAFAQVFPWPVLATSGLISPVLSAYKHWLQLEGDKTYSLGKLKVKGEVIIFALLLLLASAPSIAQAAVAALAGLGVDWRALIDQTALTGFLSQPIYFLILKPAIRSYQASIDKQVEQRMASLIAPSVQLSTTSTVQPVSQPTQFK